MEAAEHVLRYLRDIWNEAITYTRGLHLINELWGWVDVDWADTRRSHTGYVLMMNSGPISWESCRQDDVSLSTFEAEFVAASQASQEVVKQYFLCISERHSVILDTYKPQLLMFSRTTWHASL